MEHFRAVCIVPQDQVARNIEHAKSLGLPYVEDKERPPLAVCGGGHSIQRHLDEIRGWKGDRWLIGSAFKWWKSRGVDGTFFSVHPSPRALENVGGVERAIVASLTDPAVLAALADVQLFDIQDNETGATSATTVPHLSMRMGYRNVTFFGCEGSYEHDTTHVTHNDPDALDSLVKVRCGGQVFLSCAEMLMQSEYLAAMIRTLPNVFKERSGGLLAALVADPEYELTHIAKRLKGST